MLVDPDDRLQYVYDFGDGWECALRLEAVLPWDDEAPRARCVDGRSPSPPEDCGGTPGYEELVDAGAELVEFDVTETDHQVRAVLTGLQATAALPPLVAELAGRLDRSPAGDGFLALVAKAEFGARAEVSSALAAAMSHRYRWLMDRVGTDGIRLTAAGHLPPAQVEAAMSELHLADGWVGKGNREDLTHPVLSLRTSAQTLGLLRKAKGRLTLTWVGAALRRDPVDLWWQLADRMPLGAGGSFERELAVPTLVWVAAGRPLDGDGFDGYLAECGEALGWRSGNGGPLPFWSWARAADPALVVLEHALGFEPGRVGEARRPSAGGRLFSRAVLARRV